MISVSIIVPVYNAQQYLSRCLESLLNQTHSLIEIICVNDGSTDKSLEIIKKYMNQDQRIQLIDKSNTGVSDSRNQALKKVTGQYVMFVDSDDWLSLNTVEILLNEALEFNSDLVMCGYVREFFNRSKEKIFDLEARVVYEREEVQELQRRLFGPINSELGSPETLDALGTVWAKLYKSDLIQKHHLQFTDLKLIGSNEDGLFNIEAFEYLKKVIFINQPLYHYWKENTHSITSKHNPHLMTQWKILFSKMEDYITANSKGQAYEEALRNRKCLSLLGLGLNESFSGNSRSFGKKIIRWKEILGDEEIATAYDEFLPEAFPPHWRMFYSCNKRRLALPSFLIILGIDFLRKRV